MNESYRHAIVMVDDVPIDILLTDEEIKTTSKRAIE